MSTYIPEEIEFRYLRLLPVESLLRFRCVCKRWKQLIDSPTLMQEHLAVQKPRFLVECEEQEPGLVVLDPRTLPLVDTLRAPIVDQTKQSYILGTLHGVVCLYNCGDDLLLWNPSIRKSSSLPFPMDFGTSFPDGLLTCFGFWIDPSNKEYKIIILFFDGDGEPKYLNGILYSSIRHDWSVIHPGGEEERFWLPLQPAPLIIGGVAHWKGQLCLYESTNDVIMSFDFSQERFDFIDPKLSLYPFSTLCTWRGALSLVCWDRCTPQTCDIYSRQEGLWVNVFRFSLLTPMQDIFLPLEEGMEETCSVLVGQMQNSCIVQPTAEHELVLYDKRDGYIQLTHGVSSYTGVIYDFVESLLFPLE